MPARKYRIGNGLFHQVNFDTDTLLLADEWRKKQPAPPSRATVIKMAVKEFVKNHPTGK